MIALQITSMKNFMNHLLVADTFDPFLLEEATVSTALTVTIDGHINKDFYPADERGEDCIPWDLQSDVCSSDLFICSRIKPPPCLQKPRWTLTSSGHWC